LDVGFIDSKEFKFMALKLFGGSEAVDYETKILPCLYSMFNFAFGTNLLPPHIDKEDLVVNHMMTLVKYQIEFEPDIVKQKRLFNPKQEKDSYITGGFLPEGVLNFLSARYFAKYPNSFSRILMNFTKHCICSSGSYGELLAQYFLLRTMFVNIDNTFDKVRKLVFYPISLQEFLVSLGDVSISDIDPLLKNAKLSFGYFEHFPLTHIEKPFDLMARCLLKGSALSLNEFFPSLDLMIPLVLEDGRISFLGVQVINVKEKYIDENIEKAVKKMTFFNIFNQKSDRPFNMIIIAHCKSDSTFYVEPTPLIHRNPLDNPDIFVFKEKLCMGIRRSLNWFDKAPKGIMFH
jgi:hypothetical protein